MAGRGFRGSASVQLPLHPRQAALGAEEEEEEAAEAPSDKDLKEETVKILEDAGEDFSLKDLLAKLGERSHTPCNPHAFSCSGFLDQACIAHLQEGVAGTHYCNDQYLLS